LHILEYICKDMAKVFISYAKSDYIGTDGKPIKGNVIDLIREKLTENDISYWLDREQLGVGETFAERISNSIKNCDVFLFLSTAAANASQWTLREISTAINFGKMILPVRIDSSEYDTAVALYLSSIQYVDWKELGSEVALEKIISKIQNPYIDLNTGVDYGKVPKSTTICLRTALVLLSIACAFVTYLYLWPKTLRTNEAQAGIIGFFAEFGILISIYYIFHLLRRRKSYFIVPAVAVIAIAAASYFLERHDLLVVFVCLLIGWIGIFICCNFRSSKRASLLKQLGREKALMKINDPENLLLVYLLVKCIIVIAASFISTRQMTNILWSIW